MPSASQLGSSTLLATEITFCESPAVRISLATISSSGTMPSRASMTKRMSSACSAAVRICFSMSGVSAERSLPASSISPPSAL